MSKQVIFGDKAREALKRGIDTVADAVKITIGPKGRNVVIDKGYGAPSITNDGVTIAKEISLSDKIENLGAEMIKIKYPGDEKSLRWAVETAGRTKVVVSGGEKQDEGSFLNMVQDVVNSGAIGMAVGRNIWQSENPIELTDKIKKIIWQ